MRPDLGSILRDVPASLVVFLVALPLSLGIALASDAPLFAGVIAAAVGGIVVGSLGGAPLQVSGPAAGLTVLVFGLVEKFEGNWAAVCAVTVAAGLLQIGLGSLGVARVALAISPAVVHGMLAGIGILIVLGQAHVILGGTPQSSAWKNVQELPAQLGELHGAATGLGLLTLVILFAWPYIPVRAIRVIPSALAAVVVVTLVSLAFDGELSRVSLSADAGVKPIQEGHVVAAQGAAAGSGPATLLSALRLPEIPSGVPLGTIAGAVIAMTLIASVESLLCAVATDKLHDGPRAKLDKELVAQGLGNALSGMLGGLPVTGVIVRSSANIAAGARTRASAILHGVWVVVFVALLGWLIESVPKSVLAGLLVYVGARLVNLQHVRDLIRHKEILVYVVTVAGIVGKDLLVGVGLGIATSVVMLLLKLARLSISVEEREGRHHVLVQGSLTFLGIPRLTAALERLPRGSSVDVDLAVDIIDHAGLDALHVWRLSHERTGGKVDIDEVHEAWAPDAAPRERAAPERELAHP